MASLHSYTDADVTSLGTNPSGAFTTTASTLPSEADLNSSPQPSSEVETSWSGENGENGTQEENLTPIERVGKFCRNVYESIGKPWIYEIKPMPIKGLLDEYRAEDLCVTRECRECLEGAITAAVRRTMHYGFSPVDLFYLSWWIRRDESLHLPASPLRMAVSLGCEWAVKMLLDEGENPLERTATGENLLFTLCSADGGARYDFEREETEDDVREIGRVLMEHGVNPNDQNDDHETPLLLALRAGRWRLVSELILGGARMGNEEGQSPYRPVRGVVTPSWERWGPVEPLTDEVEEEIGFRIINGQRLWWVKAGLWVGGLSPSIHYRGSSILHTLCRAWKPGVYNGLFFTIIENLLYVRYVDVDDRDINGKSAIEIEMYRMAESSVEDYRLVSMLIHHRARTCREEETESLIMLASRLHLPSVERMLRNPMLSVIPSDEIDWDHAHERSLPDLRTVYRRTWIHMDYRAGNLLGPSQHFRSAQRSVERERNLLHGIISYEDRYAQISMNSNNGLYNDRILQRVLHPEEN